MFLRCLIRWGIKSDAFREKGDKNESSYHSNIPQMVLIGRLGFAKIPSRKSPSRPREG